MNLHTISLLPWQANKANKTESEFLTFNICMPIATTFERKEWGRWEGEGGNFK
jgi:hypothetical protein